MSDQHEVKGVSIIDNARVLSTTESLCPVCLKRLPARRLAIGDDIYLQKTCPEHGTFEALIWHGLPSYESWARPKTPAYPQNPSTQIQQGCPFDCGLCPDHHQQTCSALLEVTGRCDLVCPVCFAGAGGKNDPDPDLTTIEFWYRQLLRSGKPCNVQLSGGEPCLRDDLPQIISLGRSLGFTYFQVNTNGLRLARDSAYLLELKEAGLSTVFLQFDGLNNEVYEQLRGARLLAKKIEAIGHCLDVGIGVMLVPTLVPDINTQEIGNIIKFAIEHLPGVRGVHFQPVSHFGRYPTAFNSKAHLTIPDILHMIEEQTEGLLKVENFRPPGCENAYCSFHGNFVQMPNGEVKPLTHHKTGVACCSQLEKGADGAERARQFVATHWAASNTSINLSSDGPGWTEWDGFLKRMRTHSFSISGMLFQDAWTLDLERLRDCCIHEVDPAGHLIPFCAYNLTDQQGKPLYRNGAAGKS